MHVRSLQLESFRSYQKLNLECTSESQMFLGNNGEGKTNLIEALSYLSYGKSCLKASPDEAVRWEEQFFKVRADIRSDDGTDTALEFIFQTMPRRQSAYFINDVRTPILEFIGFLPSIVFLPQALELFRGPPGDRRQFLDAMVTQLKPAYASERLEYDRILKQRNALLKQIANGEANESGLELWDAELASAASKISAERRAVLDALSASLLERLQALGEQWKDVKMTYVSSVDDDEVSSMLQALRNTRTRDMAMQTTSVGPHRDDWRLIADGHDLATFASRGQQRTSLLALLFASASLFVAARHEKPIIMLDDVLSELDDHHQESLFKELQGHQFFITGTHPIEMLGEVTPWQVSAGQVEVL